MGFLTTKSFCCCLPLKTGGLALGLLSLGLCIAGSFEITIKYFRDSSHHSYYGMNNAEFATKTGKNPLSDTLEKELFKNVFFSFVLHNSEAKTMNLREF